ncbi:MAG: hypothetical protein EPO11_08190 [Gammaproteobacteria bacterium]|nr:MAG: hypothetical protein EPO11_08190 [Gammaproteobacteria bacterium]
MRRYLLAILCWMMVSVAYADEAALHFLTLADIHFDPFIACHNTVPCPLIKQLQHAPASAWPALLAKYDIDPPQYKQDSNYPLLISALSAAKQAAAKEDAKFVIVLGDFLGHNYRKYYKKYSGDQTMAGYQAFVKKTLSFLTDQLANTFPSLNVYSVVGNNDSYQGDYASDPNGKFFKDTAMIWSRLIKEKNNRAGMLHTFPIGGYYAVDIPSFHARLIVLNTVLFSSKADGEEGAAAAELNWLHNELTAVKMKHQKAMIAMHIPAGIDVYATLKLRLFRLIELWKPEDTNRFEAELKHFSPQIVGIFAGHLHSDWFQVLTFNNVDRIPVTGTPSISPIIGNNPGFKIYTYLPASQQIETFETYYYPLNQRKMWGVEYHFKGIYQTNCDHCSIVSGMGALQATGSLADYYKQFYAVGTASQPITTQWDPYYWCAIRKIQAKEYKECVK